MLSSWPQTKADYNPLCRPKGTINSYTSVINTSNNGKLTRHRQREIILCIALIIGFHRNEARARQLFSDREDRIKQCTFLYAKSLISPRRKREFSDALMDLPAALYKTARYYFKNDGSDLYDTKRFRIYRDRLEYGQPNSRGQRKITLKHTIQYMSTPLLACLFALYGGNILEPEIDQLDLSHIHCIRYAYNRKINASEIQKYLDVVLKIDGLVFTEAGRLIFQTEKAKQTFWDIVNREAETLCQELKEGGYLGS